MRKRALSLLTILALCAGLVTPVMAEGDYAPISIEISIPGLPDTTLTFDKVYPNFDYTWRTDSAPEYTVYALDSTSSVTSSKPFTIQYTSETEWETNSFGQYVPALVTENYDAFENVALDFNKVYSMGTFCIVLPPKGGESGAATYKPMNAVTDEPFSAEIAAHEAYFYGARIYIGLASNYYEESPEELGLIFMGANADGDIFTAPKPHLSILPPLRTAEKEENEVIAKTNESPADTPSSWAKEDVNLAIDSGIVPKELLSDYTKATTRAEFCALAVALYETSTGSEITEHKASGGNGDTKTNRAVFSDTTDINVEKMAALGVVNGVGDGKFAPDQKLNREQAATMLSRLAASLGKPLTAKDADFFDIETISTWAVEAVGEVQAAGIMRGTSENHFSPSQDYTREQSIITMMRLLEGLN